MKTTLYINSRKFWFNNQVYDWSEKTLAEALLSIRNNFKVEELRIILGDDVSYCFAFPASEVGEFTREKIIDRAAAYLPFRPNNEDFDWMKVEVAKDEFWIQAVAIEDGLLKILMDAIQKSGIRVGLVIPVGILIGEYSKNKDAVVLLKWAGRESLYVVAFNGLVDLVSTAPEQDVFEYAKQRWNLAVNPEEFTLTDSNLPLEVLALNMRTRGSDDEVIGINMIKKPIGMRLAPRETEKKVIFGGIKAAKWNFSVPPEYEKLVIGGTVLLSLAIGLGVGSVLLGAQTPAKPVLKNKHTNQIVSPTPTVVVTPTLAVVDVATLNVQVLNGSGVAGVAAKVKDKMLTLGFININTGNADNNQDLTTVEYRPGVEGALDKIRTSLSGYQLQQASASSGLGVVDIRVILGKKTAQ